MESYNSSEPGAADTYLIQSAEANQHLISPPLEQVEGMDIKGGPEFIVDQGLYYPNATNYYGYYCTGFESPGEWDDHNRFIGLDGTDLHYTGLQSESLPYVYYSPSYAFAQSPYNPYNPYIPGAIVGVDGPFVGTQQYYTTPLQQPGYFPVIVPPGQDIIPNSLPNPYLNTDGSNSSRPEGSGSRHNTPSVSVGKTMAPPRPASEDLRANSADTALHQTHPFSKISEASKSNVAPSKQLATHESTASGIVPPPASLHVTQGRGVSGSIQSTDHFPLGRVSSLHNSLKVTLPATSGRSDFGSNAHGWVVMDKLRPRLHYGGHLNNGNGSPDVLSEQNRGPRTNKSRSHSTPSISVKAYTTKAGASNAQGNIIIHADQYNKEDFPINYVDAIFFVIKSYSEDDVHKSIKYNVWSSTPNGNKRLDSAYGDAQRISAGKSRGCPIFLFFSVNGSGQFCGVAEMVGPVDFHKDMDFWQQDKWSGSFPVKWYIIKDVPNTNFRHIILENNENKPVTNSRDTQEIKYRQGMEMLNIFKNYALKTSILDDFMYYEERQKIMYEEKARLLGKNYENSIFLPAFVPPNKSNPMVILPPKTDERPTNQSEPDSLGKKAAITDDRLPSKGNVTESSISADDNTKNKMVEHENGSVTSVLKIGSLTINPKQSESKPLITSTVSPVDTNPRDVVTVGSMPVKVNGFSESSSGILTFGTVPIDPKARKA